MKKIIILTFLLGILTPWAQANETSEIAKTILTQKHVSAESTHSKRLLKRGDALHVNETVKTGKSARAILRFYEGTQLTLGADTAMHLENFVANETEKKAVLNFTQGAFRIITGSITQTDSPSFQVNTPIGTIGIRGTEFWGGNLNDDGSVDVLLINSEHTLVVSNEFGSVVLDQAGLGTTLKAGEAPSAAKKWGPAKVQKAVAATATE